MESSIAVFLKWLLACELQPTFIRSMMNVQSQFVLSHTYIRGVFRFVHNHAPTHLQVACLCWCHHTGGISGRDTANHVSTITLTLITVFTS